MVGPTQCGGGFSRSPGSQTMASEFRRDSEAGCLVGMCGEDQGSMHGKQVAPRVDALMSDGGGVWDEDPVEEVALAREPVGLEVKESGESECPDAYSPFVEELSINAQNSECKRGPRGPVA